MTKLFAIWLDGGGAHEAQHLMSLWTTREAAVTEIGRLQRDVYIYGQLDSSVQRFWLNQVPIDIALDDAEQGGEPFPPYD